MAAFLEPFNANKVFKAVTGHFVVQTITGFITETANAMADIGKTSGALIF